ncbi:unnamed protein product [Aureobasidium uvarum]|uniref:Uncharacterized protein n=1 Tax=Aureobasidium uvarum TaxID=2773716 RepID=A0A9N8KVG8_9PEZI|nr:unnamed protein product [Aureobasidium uvarum]
MSSTVNELAALREQILENYGVIDPDNADALLIIILRKKNKEELLMYPTVTYITEDMFEALLITDPDKGKKVLMKEFSP